MKMKIVNYLLALKLSHKFGVILSDRLIKLRIPLLAWRCLTVLTKSYYIIQRGFPQISLLTRAITMSRYKPGMLY